MRDVDLLNALQKGARSRQDDRIDLVESIHARYESQPGTLAVAAWVIAFVKRLDGGRADTVTLYKVPIECFECSFRPSWLQ